MAKARLLTTLTTLIAIFTASFPTLASADILQFGPGALPNCAYQCRPLWSAQYECTRESVAGECFCRSKYLDILNQGGGGSLCEADCPETSGGAEIRTWYVRVCASFIKQQTTPSNISTTSTRLPNPTGVDHDDDTLNNQRQTNRAVEWYVHML